MPCPSLLGLSAAPITGLSLLASVGGVVSYLFLVDACSAFCGSDLGLTVCLLLLVDLAADSGLPEQTGYACTHTVVGVLLAPLSYI